MTKWDKELIKTTRKNFKGKSISQQKLADKVGVTLRTIQRIEKGTSGSKKNLRKVATALGLDWNQVIIDDAGDSDPKENMYVLRRVMRGEELFDVLRINDLPIEYDYSPHIEGREKMDLVVEFFREIFELHKKLIEKDSDGRPSPSRTFVDLRLAPILAGLHKENCGIFAKMFCSERQSSISLEEYERALQNQGFFGTSESTRKNYFYFFAAEIDESENTSTDPSGIKTDPIELSQAYLMRRFKNREYLDKLYADDDINAPFQHIPKQFYLNNISKAMGLKNYFEEKKKIESDYFSAFFSSPYFSNQINEIQEYYDGCKIEEEDKYGIIYFKERALDDKDLDKRSYEDGQKRAALLWNAWEIFNKRAVDNHNNVLSRARYNYHSKELHFPDIHHRCWAGPENTMIDEYKRVYENEEDGIGMFENDNGDIIPINFDNEMNYFADDISIGYNQKTFYVYSLTEEFQGKIKEFCKKIEEKKIKNEEEVEPKDREAYRRALAQFEELPY